MGKRQILCIMYAAAETVHQPIHGIPVLLDQQVKRDAAHAVIGLAGWVEFQSDSAAKESTRDAGVSLVRIVGRLGAEYMMGPTK